MFPTDPPAAPHWGSVPLPPGQAAEPVARQWLAERLGCDPDALRMRRSPHGRPLLEAPAGLDCNWSHSGGRLAIALGRAMQVGIDIERERPRPRALELARRFFTAAEADWLAAAGGEDPGGDFLRLWCAKEAVLKAHGRGLAFGLENLEFRDSPAGLQLARCDPALGSPGEWRVLGLVPAPGYLGALAWRPTAASGVPATTAPGHTAPR